MEHWGSQQSVALENSSLLDYHLLEARPHGLAVSAHLRVIAKGIADPYTMQRR